MGMFCLLTSSVVRPLAASVLWSCYTLEWLSLTMVDHQITESVFHDRSHLSSRSLPLDSYYDRETAVALSQCASTGLLPDFPANQPLAAHTEAAG